MKTVKGLYVVVFEHIYMSQYERILLKNQQIFTITSR